MVITTASLECEQVPMIRILLTSSITQGVGPTQFMAPLGGVERANHWALEVVTLMVTYISGLKAIQWGQKPSFSPT